MDVLTKNSSEVTGPGISVALGHAGVCVRANISPWLWPTRPCVSEQFYRECPLGSLSLWATRACVSDYFACVSEHVGREGVVVGHVGVCLRIFLS